MSTPQQEPTQFEKHLVSLLEGVDDRHAFLREFISKLGQEGQQTIQKFVDQPRAKPSQRGVSFAQAIGARELDPAQEQALEFASLINFFNYRKSLLTNSIASQMLANLLGVSRQTIHDRFKSGQLLGILDNNILKFPDWQFDPGGPNGVIAGLPEIIDALQCSSFAKISWLSSAHPAFDNLRPIDVLKKGKIEDVIREARAVGVA